MANNIEISSLNLYIRERLNNGEKIKDIIDEASQEFKVCSKIISYIWYYKLRPDNLSHGNSLLNSDQ